MAESFQADYLVVDLESKEERHKLIEVVRSQLPDLIVNCAGYTTYGEMLALSVQEQMALLEVNALAPIELTLEAAHALIAAKKKGVILNVSSVAGEYPAPGMGLYSSAKACVTNFSRTLNTELAPKGVHVLVSCPGMVATDFASRAAGKPFTPGGGPVMTPQYAAQQIWKQIETLQEKRIFNWFYQWATFLIPASLVKKIIWNRIKKRL